MNSPDKNAANFAALPTVAHLGAAETPFVRFTYFALCEAQGLARPKVIFA